MDRFAPVLATLSSIVLAVLTFFAGRRSGQRRVADVIVSAKPEPEWWTRELHEACQRANNENQPSR